MAKLTPLDFNDVLNKKNMPKNWRELSGDDIYKLWLNTPSSPITKAEIFTRGVLLSPTRSRGFKDYYSMPEAPSEEVLNAMISSGVKSAWALDIYNAIRNEIHGKQTEKSIRIVSGRVSKKEEHKKAND